MTAPATAVAPLRSVARILVVDDDEMIRGLTRRILEGHSYEVLTSSDGAAALEVTRLAMMQPGSAINLVLTDIDMPGMDGYALGGRLALTWPTLSVVYMSGTAHGLTARVPPGARDHFIAKPFSASDLLSKLHFVLRPAARTSDDSQCQSGGDAMVLESETIATATEAARAAVAHLGEEARWALLQKWLEQESTDQRNAGRRSLRLEALRGIVSPYVSDREWDEVVREHWPVRWADQLRLTNALACVRPGAALLETPKRPALE